MTINLINSDCVEALKKIKSESVDLIFADPPYNLQLKNSLRRYQGQTTIQVAKIK